MFHEDGENETVLGVIGRTEDVDYFGYFKKMTLTLHNLIMMRRGRLPFHGAMCRIELKSGAAANVVIVGDSAAGKSESLEALRVLADEHLRSYTIIADDMGSLEIASDGTVRGYGTEIGAFVRLDDLQAMFASGVLVGQLRTRLGIPGLEQEGPEGAARALLGWLDGQGACWRAAERCASAGLHMVDPRA